MSETLSYVADDGIGTITLNRAERLNAINLSMARELRALADELHDDETLRAIVITGSGRAFCAGADIEGLKALSGPADHYRFLETIQLALNAIEALPVPTIAALNGVAFGGGCELALSCDFRIMNTSARIGVPEVKLGLLPGAGGTQRLPRLLPPPVAKEMIYFGEALTADKALHHGLVNAVVPGDDVLTTAYDWAKRARALAPLALRSAKLLVHGAALDGVTNGIEAERQAVAFLFQTSDAAEGIQAFLDKRPPDFNGK